MTTVIQPEGLGDYQLVALDRGELQSAHAKMVEWVKARIDHVDVDVQVEEAALEAAVAHGFVRAPFERRINRLNLQRRFYTKILAALEAGYAIVPNFQMNVFAIRTSAKAPRGSVREGRWNAFIQPAQLLPAGDGRYTNPVPTVVEDSEKETDAAGRDVTKWFQWPEEFQDLAFPMALAKPELMTATGQAMALKIFDEVGVAVDTHDRLRGGGRGDPILLGRLLNPRSGRPSISFFIGWYFDPSRL